MSKLQNPTGIANKWMNGMSSAKPAYEAGVRAVQIAPGEQAAQAAPRMLEGVRRSVESGEYAAAARSVSLPDWQQAAIEKGADRLASGARAAKNKVDMFWTQFAPFLQRVRENLPPRGDEAQNEERMIQNMRAIKEFRFNRRGG